MDRSYWDIWLMSTGVKSSRSNFPHKKSSVISEAILISPPSHIIAHWNCFPVLYPFVFPWLVLLYFLWSPVYNTDTAIVDFSVKPLKTSGAYCVDETQTSCENRFGRKALHTCTFWHWFHISRWELDWYWGPGWGLYSNLWLYSCTCMLK